MCEAEGLAIKRKFIITIIITIRLQFLSLNLRHTRGHPFEADVRGVPGGAEGAEGAEGAGGAEYAGGTGDEGDEGGTVRTAMLKISSIYPLCSCGDAAEACKYAFDFGVQVLSHHMFGLTFQEMAFWSSEEHQ